VARLAEELGFESIFYGEHPIRPVGQAGQSVHADGIPFFQDTVVMLARASAVTERIRLGGGVFLIPEHNPVLFAKQLASIDHYSGGRLLVGAGIGWSRTECEVLGGNYDRRWEQAAEAIVLMKRLWSEDTVEFHGEFFEIPPIQLFPQPARKPWPPVLIGGSSSEANFQRVIEYGDGWIPAFVTPESIATAPERLEAARRRLDALAVEGGRDPSTIQITAILRGPQIDGDMNPRGSTTVDRALLVRLAGVGVDRVAISLSTITSEDDAKAALTRIADIAL
jgi:probable F420-dependent oxidoreductase